MGGSGSTSSSYSLESTISFFIQSGASSSSNFKVASGYQGITNAIPASNIVSHDAGLPADTTTPILLWDYSDKDAHPQRYYHVQISQDNFATIIVDSGIVGSSQQSYTTPLLEPSLENYQWRVRTHDGYDWSGWIETLTGFKVRVLVFTIPSLKALTEPFGKEIASGTWQEDNDPYMFWEEPEGGGVVGYSYSWDNTPDETIDTTDLYYITPVDSLSDGKHIFYLKALNTAGNWSETISFDMWVDTLGPVVTVFYPAAGVVVSDDLTPIWVQAHDSSSGLDFETRELKVNLNPVQTAYEEATGKVTFSPTSPLSEGSITVSFNISDKVGNKMTTLVWNFVVDTVAPTGSIVINNGELFTNSVYVNLDLEAEDVTTSVEEMMLSNYIDFAGAQWQRFSTHKENWALLPINGKRAVYVKFRDKAGNESSVYWDDIELSIIAPETLITVGPSGVTDQTQALFGFSSSMPASLFSWKFDDEPWSAWSDKNTALKENLSEGNHYFLVKAGKDLNNNGSIDPEEQDPTPAQRTWTVRTTAPSVAPQKPIKYWRRE
jgi:hypothetical protein